MDFNFKEIHETIRISKGRIKIGVMVSSGMDGDYHIIISPTLSVSGYGKTEKEAIESFEHNMSVFCEDIMNLNQEKQYIYLHKLGFHKERYRAKNFRNSYNDKNNLIGNLEPATRKTQFLEAAY